MKAIVVFVHVYPTMHPSPDKMQLERYDLKKQKLFHKTSLGILVFILWPHKKLLKIKIVPYIEVIIGYFIINIDYRSYFQTMCNSAQV